MVVRLNRRVSASQITVFVLAFLIVILETPALSRTLGDEYILPIAALYFLLVLNQLLNLRSDERIVAILLILYIVPFILGYKLLGISTSEYGSLFSTSKFFLAFFIILPIYRKLERKQMVFLLVVAVGAMLVTMVYNAYLHSQLDYRYSIQLFAAEDIRGVMNTQYTSAILFASGAFACAVFHFKSKRIRLLFLLLTVFYVLFNITVTQRGIVLILSIIMFPFLLLCNEGNNVKRTLFILFAALLSVFAVLKYDVLLSWLGRVLGSQRLSDRLNSIILAIKRGNVQFAGGSLTARYDLILTSIRTFFGSVSNFMIGVGDHRSNNLLIGNHSQFADEFARYGIFGGGLSCLALGCMLKLTRKMAQADRKTVLGRQLSVLFLIMILRGCVGTLLDSTIGVQMFITIPILFRLMKDDKSNGIKSRG